MWVSLPEREPNTAHQCADFVRGVRHRSVVGSRSASKGLAALRRPLRGPGSSQMHYVPFGGYLSNCGAAALSANCKYAEAGFGQIARPAAVPPRPDAWGPLA